MKNGHHDHHKSNAAHVARMLRRVAWCDRNIPALELMVVREDANGVASGDPRDGEREDSPRQMSPGLLPPHFLEEAYDAGMVPRHYYDDLQTIMPWEKVGENIMNPSPEFLASLSSRQTLACIAYHFRADHFDNWSLVERSLPTGSLLKLMVAYRDKALAEIASYDDKTISKGLLRAFKEATSPSD